VLGWHHPVCAGLARSMRWGEVQDDPLVSGQASHRRTSACLCVPQLSSTMCSSVPGWAAATGSAIWVGSGGARDRHLARGREQVTGDRALEITVYGWDLFAACGACRPVLRGPGAVLPPIAPLLIAPASGPGLFAGLVWLPGPAGPADRWWLSSATSRASWPASGGRRLKPRTRLRPTAAIPAGPAGLHL
jgi:hypothetical protein